MLRLQRSLLVNSCVSLQTTVSGARAIRSAGATFPLLLRVGLSALLLLSLTSCRNGTSGSDPEAWDFGPLDLGSGDIRPREDHTTEPTVRRRTGQCGFSVPPAALIDVSKRYNEWPGETDLRVDGWVHSIPSQSFHTVVMEEGSCRYLKAAFGFCDPPCGYYETCIADGECVQIHPEPISGGLLTVTGLGEPIKIETSTRTPGWYHWSGGPPLPLFEAGDAVGAALSGAEFPPVTLAATGIAPMDTDLAATGFKMKDGQDVVLTWTAGPDPEACIQVVLNGFNMAHGQPLNDIIRCEGPDSGSMVVPQAMVEAFPPGETPEATVGNDWPLSELTRYTRDVAETTLGPAELVVRSTVYFRLSHPE